MPSFTEARNIILDRVTPLGIERVGILEAAGRVLAEDVVAPWEMPLCDNSAMDGFAVRAADCATIPAALKVTGYIPAGGEVTGAVESGCAIRIMTGAPLPPGCDAVVPVEETEDDGAAIRVVAPVKERQHIRFKGEDVATGETVIPAGTLIQPPEVSMLASFGKALVPVFRKARVAILSTGDELVELGEPPVPGKIINSNTLSLAAAVRQCGAEPIVIGIARDNRESHREKLAEGLKADALITSAGVSAGDRDLVRDVLAEMGVEQIFWKVDMKPGGPTAFGMHGAKPVFSLPGNPVSTMVTFELFARPALLRMMGHRRVVRPFVKAILREDAKKKPGKVNFLRVQVTVQEGRFVASTAGDQHTGILRTMVRANGLALLPLEASIVHAGSEVDLMLLRDDVTMLER
ncbi:molybdenum cofactor synthesis domain protein [Geobacter metallireducens RCH3]|uniref:Molybdopterin molybdenumtransferase n=1 Tax=Geobacter metallireducens (strain ATCC 53774 / DSM 7210 / GS-15) TaxID=269799 RepID=Q39WU6_GEOMG|nr:gephyrin-like molybdotransferase Glp [Geobacter metallireducens]ABB31278.1 molybdopterin--molybdenum ligase [Geobacter metallireducens GS-15]EHP86525.1 molybdenum cofactor synthesis domain protein [Geobacter metallireducens RCH3]